MGPFISKEKYEELQSQFNGLKEQNTALQAQMETLAAQAANSSALQEQLTAITGERDSALTEVSTLKQTNADLTAQLETLKAENETLRNLPGAESATTTSDTESSNGEPLSDLDKLNEFCKTNANDVNACVAAINKFKLK